MKKTLTKILITFFIYIASILMFSCYAKDDITVYKENKQYVLNRSSKKIHVPSCNSAIIMSDRNRKNVEDSLENLLDNGYSICKNCNAGIKKNFIIGFFNNDEDLELPTIEEYRNAIDIMGEWYVNHIPTYQTELEMKKISDYTGTLKYYKEYMLRNICHGKTETTDKYYVLSTDSNANNVEELEPNSMVLAGTENAIKYYKSNYNFIKKHKKKDTYYYPCNLIKGSAGSYDNPGDDCVRFIFSILNLCDNKFVKTIEKESKYKWSVINTSKFLNDMNVEKAFKKMGFEVYENIDSNCGNSLISDKTTLESGDLLVRQGHVHIYLGNHNNEYAFGWGRVNDSYPILKTFKIKYTEKDRYYFSSLENDNKGNLVEKKYVKIYRYIGGKK